LNKLLLKQFKFTISITNGYGQQLTTPIKKYLQILHNENSNLSGGTFSKAANIGPASTVFSSLKRLMQNGNVIKTEKGYEVDDPFFKKWIIDHRDL